jgi:hypothetical protein
MFHTKRSVRQHLMLNQPKYVPHETTDTGVVFTQYTKNDLTKIST